MGSAKKSLSDITISNVVTPGHAVADQHADLPFESQRRAPAFFRSAAAQRVNDELIEGFTAPTVALPREPTRPPHR